MTAGVFVQVILPQFWREKEAFEVELHKKRPELNHLINLIYDGVCMTTRAVSVQSVKLFQCFRNHPFNLA